MSSRVSQTKANPGILAQRHARDARRYFDRHGCGSLPALPAPDPGLAMVVMVPALAEPDAVATLESLAVARRPDCAVEIVLLVNAADNAAPEIKRVNAQCLEDANAWAAGRHDRRFGVHVLDYCALPADRAGVGLARKLGMDIALARLAAARAGCGVIVSLDADCRVAPTYLPAIHDYFRNAPAALGATLYFEHPLDDTPVALRQAIIEYELHLRCYKHGLQAAASPYARYTVGSAFAVRSEIYAQEGGMNRRPAGEDFYFINKLQKRGHVGEITGTTVFPSARVSKRVPFGTGAAMSRAGSQSQTSYAPAVFRELQQLQTALEAVVRHDRPVPSAYATFLDTMAFATWLSKTQANVASVESLQAQLRRWLDGFRTMKFLNWLTESRYPRVPVADAAHEILTWRGVAPAREPQSMLEQLRALDR